NLLGDFNFCPMVRRTRVLRAFEKKELNKSASKKHAPLHIEPPPTRIQKEGKERQARFAKLLQEAKVLKTLTLKSLIHIHNKAVGKAHAEKSFRHHQNYLA